MSTPIPNATDGSNENEPAKEDTIFLDVADMRGYDKNLKTARNYLYILAAVEIFWGIYTYFQIKDISVDYALIFGGSQIGLGIIFIILAIWSYKMPSAAFLTALIFFALVIVILAFIEVKTIFSGIILKVLAIIALVKGFKDAREYEQMKRSLGTSQQ